MGFVLFYCYLKFKDGKDHDFEETHCNITENKFVLLMRSYLELLCFTTLIRSKPFTSLCFVKCLVILSSQLKL